MMLLREIGVSIPLYARGVGGIPTTNVVGPDLAGRVTAYQHSIAAVGGFQSMSIGFVCDRHEAVDILTNWIGRGTIVTGPAAQTIWEGQLCEISATFGQRTTSVSLDTMSNRVRVRYSTASGADVTATVSDADSIALYGTRDGVEAFSSINASAALNAANRILAQRRVPAQTPSTTIKTGPAGDVSVELRFRGWYATLGWILTSNASTTVTATDTQIAALITAVAAVNAFIPSSGHTLGVPGVSDLETIDADTSYLDKIERLVKQGDGVDRWVLMCLENRLLTFRKWAGAAPATLHYVADMGGYQVFNPSGGLVQPWDVRPDTMYQEIGLLDAAPSATGYDTAGRQYVERVTCTIGQDGAGVTLDPAASDGIDVLLAALGG